jgi:hypothetical protein
MTDLGSLPNCQYTDSGRIKQFSEGVGINDSGTIIGRGRCGGGNVDDRSFILRNGVYTTLPRLGGFQSYPSAINSSGTVVGKNTDASGSSQSYLYDGTLHVIPQLPICAITTGVLSTTPQSAATDINDLGHVVGGSCGDAYLYTGGQLTDLGIAPLHAYTNATAINNYGQIGGLAGNGPTGAPVFAVVFDWASGQWYDLAPLTSGLPAGVTLGSVDSINDSGQILATGWNQTRRYAFLLTPSAPPSTAAPLNSSVPVVSGLPVSGDLLSSGTGSWSGPSLSYSYQWMRCSATGTNCVDVPGGTNNTYPLTAADLTFTIRVRVTATNQYGTASAQSDPTAVIQTPLNAFAPEFWYDHRDSYRADLAAELTDNCWDDSNSQTHNNILFDGTNNPLASVCAANGPSGPLPHLSLDYLLPSYPGGQASTSDDHIDEYNDYVTDFQRFHDLSQYKDRVYGRAVPGLAGATILQYWFYYYYNGGWVINGSLGGEHEGDWEGMQLYIDPNGNPVDATYYQHGGGERCDWNFVSHNGLHPRVFVANGSHASYFTSGDHPAGTATDHAEAGVPPLIPNVEDITAYEAGVGWLYWRGRWGGTISSGLPGEQNSPTGPSQQAQWDALNWRSSAAAHSCTVPTQGARTVEHPSTTDQRQKTPSGTMANVPVPRVRAHQIGGRKAVLTYCFATAPKSPARRPRWIQVALQSADRKIPPYSKWWKAQLPCGRLTQPTGRGPRPFHAVVTAATKTGAESRIVRVTVR